MAVKRTSELVRSAIDDIRYERARRTRRWLRVRGKRVFGRAAALVEGERDMIYPVAFGDRGRRLLVAIEARTREAGLPTMRGGDPGSSVRIVHVEREHLGGLLAIVAAESSEPVVVRQQGEPDADLDDRLLHRLARAGRSIELLVVERVAGHGPAHRMCSHIVVAVWVRDSGAYGTKYVESDQEFAAVGRLSPKLMERLGARHHDFDAVSPRAPSQPDFPIDVVYTWVDGDDPRWDADKRRVAADLGRSMPRRVVHDERFRSRDELRYSLRSLELFAPWVRRVFIVTADQTPTWLDTSHPKIQMVSHRDIYADASWLPTFNSSGIETQLHHIDGLARHFLYFNDDFLLGQLTEPGDFFWSNGMLKFFPSEQRVYVDDISGESEEYIQADRNAVELFSPVMSEVGRSIMRHVPYPSDRELLDEMEQRWPGAFAACASSPFRSSSDLRPIAFMQYHYGYATQRAVPADITHRYLALWKASILDQLSSVATSRAYATMCINDVGLQPERERDVDDGVISFLESYFPAPSTFEIDR